jgi:sugar lactone lactonase YvrE
MRIKRTLLSSGAALVVATALTAPANAGATPQTAVHHVHLLVSGLQGGLGSTVGPDGALYVPEGLAGRISRVDPKTGHVTTFASGLPKRVAPVGGAMDVAFLHGQAYVLVALVSPDVGGTDVDGIYRVDGPHRFTVIADIGAWSIAHPPKTDFFIPSGVQFALEAYRGGFLVTDGHHNRILRVGLNGKVSQRLVFGDIVPTGLALKGTRVFMAEAGPVPHLPRNGRIVTFAPGSHHAHVVASGARLLVDVEVGPGGVLYGLSQGHFTPGQDAGSPADPNTGALERVNADGTMSAFARGLNQPTSFQLIGHTAYVVTLNGEIWTVDNI